MGFQCRRQLCFLCRVPRSLELLTSLSLSLSLSLSFPGIKEGTGDQWETLRNCTWRPRFAHLDDTQLNHSESPENYSDLVRSLQDCVKDIGLWTEENKLKLNNDKTEAIRFSTSSSISTTLPHSQTIFLSNTEVEFSGTVRNLGFIFDSDLLTKQHIIKMCKAAYIEIRRISSIHQYLIEDATKTLVNLCLVPEPFGGRWPRRWTAARR